MEIIAERHVSVASSLKDVTAICFLEELEQSSILGPLVLAANLLLLLGREVVGDVERLSDLLGGLALDHVCNRFASDIEELFDVEVVGRLAKRG